SPSLRRPAARTTSLTFEPTTTISLGLLAITGTSRVQGAAGRGKSVDSVGRTRLEPRCGDHKRAGVGLAKANCGLRRFFWPIGRDPKRPRARIESPSDPRKRSKSGIFLALGGVRERRPCLGGSLTMRERPRS